MPISNKKILIHIAAKNSNPLLNFALIADLNNDGTLDFLDTNTEIGSTVGNPIQLYLSNSQGTYVNSSYLITDNFTSLWTQKILAADLNSDGLQDIILGAAPEQNNSRVNNGIGTNTDNHLSWGSPQYVLFQNKDGTYSPVQTISGTFEAHSVNLTDFNNDGLKDILYVSDVNGSGNLQYPRLLLNNGDKTFTLANLSNIVGPQDSTNTFHSFWATVGDFNNDGNQDIVFLNGGYQNGAYDFVAYGNGKGSFTKGALLPMIPKQYGGENATIEGDAVLDLNHDGYQDLLVWVIDRSNQSLGDISPGHLMVMINDTHNGFIDETIQWLGNFSSSTIGSDTRSLQGYIPGTSLIPLWIMLPVKGADNGYVQEPIFLYNTGSQLLPIFDPYWNSEILNGNGANMQNSNWQMQNGQITTVYYDWNVNLVSVTLSPVNELDYYKVHNPFVVIDLNLSIMKMDDGFAFTTTKYQPWFYKAMPDWVKNTSRLIEENTPGNRVIVGTNLSDFIAVGNDYAGVGNNVLIGNGGDDSFIGGSGINKIVLSPTGNSYVYGGTGIALIYIDGNISSYSISTDSSSTLISSGAAKYTIQNGTDVIFNDYTLNLSTGKKINTATDNQLHFIDSENSVLSGKNQIFIVSSNHTLLIKENSSDVSVVKISNVLYVSDKFNIISNDAVISDVPRLQFLDMKVAYDIDGVAGQAYRIYQAAFNRTPDNGGLKYWIGLMDGGVSLPTVSSAFIASAEFKALYGINPTNEVFISKLYDNVLHRAPDIGGYNYWVELLNTKKIDNISTLINFSESTENQAGVIGVIQNGIDLLN